MHYDTTFQLNGVATTVSIQPGRTLLSVLRDDLGLVGTKEGCTDAECGACMVMVDGQPLNSCSYLAVQVDGRSVTTVEGLAAGDELSALQRAFLVHGGVQCGFCTPGMLISATALIARDPDPSEESIRASLSGNLCRCTGYQGIVKAVQAAAAEVRADDARYEEARTRALELMQQAVPRGGPAWSRDEIHDRAHGR